MKRRRIRYILALAVIFLVICLCRSCCYIFVDAGQEVFTSPQETRTIIIQYDFVSRPSVYKKTLLGKRKIWAYPGPGFMETVHFGVEWLSEQQVRLVYDDLDDRYDEEFVITVP